MKRTIFTLTMLTMMVTLSAENPYKVYTQGLPFEMPEVNAAERL